MTKPPLSPFLLDPGADSAPPDRAEGGCASHAAHAAGCRTLELDAAELFVCATLRAWVAPLMRPGELHPDWRELFRLAGVAPSGAMGFDVLMSIVAAQARRMIDVHCCRCPRLGEDETAMLRLVAGLQSGDTLAALDVLGDWLPVEAVGQALHAARRFALVIADAGLTLPRPGRAVAFPRDRRTLH